MKIINKNKYNTLSVIEDEEPPYHMVIKKTYPCGCCNTELALLESEQRALLKELNEKFYSEKSM